MKPKDRVCSLELSNQFKELGVKQKSLWWWVSVRKQEPELYYEEQLGMLECNSPYAYKRICSAFTIAELYQIIYDEGLSFGLPNRLKPEVIPNYMASFLIMALRKKRNETP